MDSFFTFPTAIWDGIAELVSENFTNPGLFWLVIVAIGAVLTFFIISKFTGGDSEDHESDGWETDDELEARIPPYRGVDNSIDDEVI